jgi:hypothetical protein
MEDDGHGDIREDLLKASSQYVNYIGKPFKLTASPYGAEFLCTLLKAPPHDRSVMFCSCALFHSGAVITCTIMASGGGRHPCSTAQMQV